MVHTEIKQRIIEIQDIFDIGAKGCSKAMSITVQSFRNRMSDKTGRNNFNEKNLQDLIAYIKTEAEKL
ncbi:MAG: hypothetical protein Q4B43_04260 [Bacteroidota bacterium]|nr:hypothetical protein [Bacteroidota bacterium]